MTDNANPSLLPYEQWAARALRAVAVDALRHAAEHGLPGEHHFYLSFRTDHPGTIVPGHLKAKYPREMTIVLQHRFWDLAVDPAGERFSVGLSFNGIPAMLTVPFAALTAFHDPYAQFGLRFEPEFEDAADEEVTDITPPAPEAPPAEPAAPAQPQVVSLDAFRRKRE
ncbi:MAG: hypothetical protein K2X11_20485 [Acetobacteraceae bacterium]|nr:hypothetical protein [Acetobacteraceae bacterium]